MKKYLIFLLLLLSAGCLFALDGMFIGLGVDTKANTREGTTIGGDFQIGLELNRSFALGLETVFTHDTRTVGALEVEALFRYNLPIKIKGPFLQLEAGTVIFFEYGDIFPAFLGGLAAGWRFTIGKNWYIEPTVRGGYPFIWGAGLAAGIRLPFSKKS
jgi:hypothetical protein